MPKLALFPYPHFKRKPKVIEPASKEDTTKIITRLELIAKIRLLSPKDKRRLLKLIRKGGKV